MGDKAARWVWSEGRAHFLQEKESVPAGLEFLSILSSVSCFVLVFLPSSWCEKVSEVRCVTSLWQSQQSLTHTWVWAGLESALEFILCYNPCFFFFKIKSLVNSGIIRGSQGKTRVAFMSLYFGVKELTSEMSEIYYRQVDTWYLCGVSGETNSNEVKKSTVLHVQTLS